MRSTPVIRNSWRSLRRYTEARIGMGRSGISLTTRDQLAFQLDHACAQDAVRKAVDWRGLAQSLETSGIPLLKLSSRATDRDNYLQRPDLGRVLSPESETALRRWRENHSRPVDICIGISDGLSALAVEHHAQAMLNAFVETLKSSPHRCSVVCLVEQGRVAISDEIASRLDAPFMAMLIGERPGLSSPDSLGVYFTYQAQPGFTDAQRNCISNIRPKGLSVAEASRQLRWLIEESERLGQSGVQLKDTRLQGSLAGSPDAAKTGLLECFKLTD